MLHIKARRGSCQVLSEGGEAEACTVGPKDANSGVEGGMGEARGGKEKGRKWGWELPWSYIWGAFSALPVQQPGL